MRGLIPLVALAIPIVAIIGGITAGILRTRGQQRLVELAQRERIAAIEKGIDPGKLPPLPVVTGGGDDLAALYMSPRQIALRRAQGLLIGGLVTFAAGLGLSLMLYLLADASDHNAWAVGLVPGFIGLALMLSSFIVHRTTPEDDRGPRA